MTASTPNDSVLALAHRQEIEEKEFRQFQDALKEVLKRSQFSCEGKSCTLAEYLDWRLEHRTEATGDEQPVVDTLIREILQALGYSPGDITYNERLPGMAERAVPDYTVYVRDVLGSAPVFLVENKATTVASLSGPEIRGESDSPLAQLRRYVLSGVVQGRIGLLSNGFLLEAWEFAAGGDMRLTRVNLHALARAALAEDRELPGEQETAQRTLWNRFSRAAFLRAHDLRRVSAEVPPLPPKWVDRVRANFEKAARPGAVEEDLIAYYEEVWEESAIDVSASPELLVDTLRGLIEQFSGDVLNQLEEALRRHEEYEAAVSGLEADSRQPRLRQPLELRRHSFDLSPEEFEERFLEPLDVWCRRPRLDGLDDRLAGWIAGLEPHVRLPNSESAEQLELDKANSTQPKSRDNGPALRKKRVLADFKLELRRYCEAVLEEFAARQQLDEEYATARVVADAYQTWAARVSSSVLVGAPEAVFHREFARQTAYVYVVRLLLVRICEDKGLFQRKLSDGGLLLWQGLARRYLDYAAGRSYEYLSQMAYECAQNVYVHFYGASKLFDWYRMDEKTMIRALLVLNAFNLEAIDTDIIGAVYGRYLEEGKHEQGRFYTPRVLVRAMLDLAGYRGEAVIGRRIADLACGSGSFLVEACRRLLDQFRDREGKIPTAKLVPALEEAQRSLYGVEINPFACYLAETNLLIQVLDLVRQAQEAGLTLTVDRFRIYSGDALLVDQQLAKTKDTALMLLGEDRAILEQLKARTGRFERGFDFLVGNPPYVRADEEAPAYLSYRRLLNEQEWFTTRYLKWDLYVPFVEQYHRLLSDDLRARCCLVTIESIKNAPYATRLRELLTKETTLHDVLLTRGLRLFEDASWQDNVVFCFSRGAPVEGHRVRRRVARERAPEGALRLESLDEPEQTSIDPDQVFRVRKQVELDLSGTVPWEEICYVSVGMVLNSNEKLEDGEVVRVPSDYDPEIFKEELVEDLGDEGKRIRHRPFTRDELIAESRDEIHTRPYLDSRQVLRGGVGAIQWLEYGPHTRVPARIRRPTFPELFEVPKVMFGSFVGVAVDDGTQGDYLLTPHNVRLAIKWALLAKVENRSLKKAREALGEKASSAPKLSRKFSDWYLCALALSDPIQKWLQAKRRSMKDDVYPDDIKAIPVKRLSPKKQQPFIVLEQERHGLWRELVEMEAEGFTLGERVEVPVHPLAKRFRQEHPEIEHLTLAQLPPSVVEIEERAYSLDLSRARAVEDQVLVGREVIARVGESIENKPQVAQVLARLLASMPGTLADRQSLDALPRTENGLLTLAAYWEEQEAEVRRRQTRIEEIQAEIDRLAWELYG